MEKNNESKAATVGLAGDPVGAWYGTEPVVPESAITETIKTEILICGAGTGGMVAALVAAKKGAKTLIIEKNSRIGFFRTYVGAVDSRAQKAVGDKARINKAEIVQELVNYADKCGHEFIQGANPVNEKLVQLWADESGETVDFMADELATYGITHVSEYEIGDGYHGKFRIYPAHTKFIAPLLKSGPMARQHAGILAIDKWMVKKAESYGAQFRFNTPLIKLIKDGNKVVGVIAGKKDGSYVRINAEKGVLLCTGGYPGDPDLVAKLNPEAAAVTALDSGLNENTGDGIKAGIWAGGEKDAIPVAMIFDRGPLKPGEKAGPPFKVSQDSFAPFHFGSQPFMKVNMEGKRFSSESVPYDAIIYPLLKEKNHALCIIWDGNYWENVKGFSTIGCSRMVPSKSKPKTLEGAGRFGAFGLITMARMRGYVKKARTIEGLAKKLKLPVDALKATVERYNRMAKAGVDEDFGKPAKDLFALETPPFYGITLSGHLLTTMDGLHINTDMQVLDKNGNAIEGLYAAGDVAGGFFANNYYAELIPGVACGKTITFARHAVLHMMR